MLSSLGNLLAGRIGQRSHIAKGVTTAMILETCQKVLDQKIGPTLATAVSLKDGTLVIRASQPSIAQDLQFTRQELKESCNADCGREVVMQIKVVI